MIPFVDSMGNKRGIDVNLTQCGKYVNHTLYAAKNTNGSTVQMNLEAFKEFIELGNILINNTENTNALHPEEGGD